MAEESRPWAGTTLGDAGPYSDDDWDDIWEVLFGSGVAPYNDRGVIRNWANELEVTDGGANQADVDTGAALVHGKFYKNTAVVNVAVPSSVGAWREDLICLQSSWAAQTIRIARHANPADGVAYPAPTQTDGVTWEIPLAAVRINNAGAITLITDLRDYVSDLMQPKSIQKQPRADSPWGARGGYNGVNLAVDLQTADFGFIVPNDFKELLHAWVRIIPNGTGTFDYTTFTTFAACGELYTTHNDSQTDNGIAVTDGEIICIDIAASFTNIAAGDEVALGFRRDAVGGATTALLVIDFEFVYK